MTTLATRGTGGYRQYRIPAIAATPAGLVCAFDARLNLDDLPAPIDLLTRTSTDFGKSWGEPTLVRTGEGFEGFGDPSLLYDHTRDQLLLFHSATVHAGFFESSASLDDADPGVQHVDLSTFDGSTWHTTRISGDLRRTGSTHLERGGAIAGIFVTSGMGYVIEGGPHHGRLVQPCVLRVDSEVLVACALSDDGGTSWHLGSPVPCEMELNESSVTGLPDGRLVLHSRGVGHRWQAFSDDGGETFTEATALPEVVDSGTNGSVLALGDVLFASHTADPNLRRRAVISRSDDCGETWHEVHLITPGAAGYTQLVPLPSGDLGVIYEANGYQEIVFQRVPAAELATPLAPDTAGESDPAVAEVATGPASAPGWVRATLDQAVLDIVLRSITPPEPSTAAGKTHEIDLATFTDIPTTVFKEIGATRADTTQTLRTREGLRVDEPFSPGIHPEESLTFHARLRNTTQGPQKFSWAGEERTLAPGEKWVKRDLHVEVTDAPSSDAEVMALCPRPATE